MVYLPEGKKGGAEERGEGKGKGFLLIVYLVCFPECPLLGWNIIVVGEVDSWEDSLLPCSLSSFHFFIPPLWIG